MYLELERISMLNTLRFCFGNIKIQAQLSEDFDYLNADYLNRLVANFYLIGFHYKKINRKKSLRSKHIKNMKFDFIAFCTKTSVSWEDFFVYVAYKTKQLIVPIV